MSSVLENAYLRHRLRQMDQLYPEPSVLGHCDCTSYSYFALSIVLIAIGTLITVLALGDGIGYLFTTMGHVWLVGPIFICSGLMIAVKSILHLRRKRVIQMLLRQRALLRGLQELAQQSRNQQPNCIIRNPSIVTLPPTYEALMGASASHGSGTGAGSAELPPPTYEEAMFLIGDEKLQVVLEDSKFAASSDDELSKEACTASPSRKGHLEVPME